MTEHEFLDLFPGNICFVTLDDTRKDPTLRHYHEGFKESRKDILSALYNEISLRIIEVFTFALMK